MRVLLPMLLLSVATLAFAQGAKRANVRYINPPTIAKPTGYTHMVEVRGGRTVYISGQVALDKSGAVVGKDDFRAQAQQVFENLKAALEAAGGNFSHLIKTNIYVTDMSQLQALREIRAGYYKSDPPASTLVQVVRLAQPEFMLEIEAIAVLPE